MSTLTNTCQNFNSIYFIGMVDTRIKCKRLKYLDLTCSEHHLYKLLAFFFLGTLKLLPICNLLVDVARFNHKPTLSGFPLNDVKDLNYIFY